MNEGSATASDAVPTYEPTHVLREGRDQDLNEFCDVVNIRSWPNIGNVDYISVTARFQSFRNWTLGDTQNPKDLAEAGFYYTGQEDCVRCFMCKSALSSWDTHDIPFYEHYRWFGKCLYVTECYKHPVVAAIINTAQKMHHSISHGSCQHPNGHSQHGRTQCDQAGQSDITTTSTTNQPGSTATQSQTH